MNLFFDHSKFSQQAEEEAKAYLNEFEASFGEKQTTQTFVKSATIIQSDNQQVVVESTREEYKMDGLKKLSDVCFFYF